MLKAKNIGIALLRLFALANLLRGFGQIINPSLFGSIKGSPLITIFFKLLFLAITLLNKKTRQRIFVGRWLNEEVPVSKSKTIAVVLARVYGFYLIIESIWQVIDPSRFVNSKTSPVFSYILGVLILIPTVVDVELQRRIFVGWWFENQKPVGRGKIVGVVLARSFGFLLVLSAFLYAFLAFDPSTFGNTQGSPAILLFFGVVILSSPRPNKEDRKRRAIEWRTNSESLRGRSKTIEKTLVRTTGIILALLGSFYLWRAFPYAGSTGDFIPTLMIILGIGIWSRPLEGVLLTNS